MFILTTNAPAPGQQLGAGIAVLRAADPFHGLTYTETVPARPGASSALSWLSVAVVSHPLGIIGDRMVTFVVLLVVAWLVVVGQVSRMGVAKKS